MGAKGRINHVLDHVVDQGCHVDWQACGKLIYSTVAVPLKVIPAVYAILI